MILTQEQVLHLIKFPRNSESLRAAGKFHDKHRLHVLGEGYDKALVRLENFESETQFEIKKKYSEPSTPRIFEQIINQDKKIFRAQGFLRQHKFKNNDVTLMNDFRDFLKDVGGGISIEEVMLENWFKAMYTDFNGLFMVELPEFMEEGESPKPFIKFVESCFIHDLHVKGSRLEYLILTWRERREEKEVEVFRVIDDTSDSKYIKDNGEIFLDKRINKDGELVDDIIENIWGYVPAIQASTIKYSIDKPTLKSSPVMNAIPEADKYLRAEADHTVSYAIHGKPIMYSYPIDCPVCKGEGTLLSESEKNPCITCNGTGKGGRKLDTSEGIILPEPEEGEAFNAQSPMGYVVTPIETLADQRIELELLEAKIKSVLGVEGILTMQTKRETALGKELDLQPLLDRLNDRSKNAETVEQFLTETLAKARYFSPNESDQVYEGSIIHWGRTYLIKSKLQIENEYSEGKKNGLNDTFLVTLLKELILTTYENKPRERERALIIFELEIAPTYTLKETVDLGVFTKEDLVLKQYLNDYIERFERDNGNIVFFMDGAMFKDKIEAIKDIINGYNKEKITKLQSNGEEVSKDPTVGQ